MSRPQRERKRLVARWASLTADRTARMLGRTKGRRARQLARRLYGDVAPLAYWERLAEDSLA